MASPTIIDIARAAGVSFKTVARVINREPSVKAETRKRVEAAIAKLKYRPNVWARTLRSSRSHLLAVIRTTSPEVDVTLGYAERVQLSSIPHYVMQVQVAAMSACQRAGYHLITEELSTEDTDQTSRTRKFVLSTHIDGALLLPPVADNIQIIKALIAAKIPFVRVAPCQHLDLGSYVYMDDQLATYQLTSMLCGLGHRDIAFIRGPSLHQSDGMRFRGFEAAMKKHGGNLRPEWIENGDFSTTRWGMAPTERLLARSQRPSAIVAFNDDIAVGAVFAALRKGLVLPRDLSVVGFDDMPLASLMWPGLTTVHQPVTEMVQTATEMLIEQIEISGARQVRKFEFEIVVRESTAPPARKIGKSRLRR